MTEPEWLASDDPQAMLGYLQSPSDNANPNHLYPPSDRKLRLFACAVSRLCHPNGYWEGRKKEEKRVYDQAESIADGLDVATKKLPSSLPQGLAALLSKSAIQAVKATLDFVVAWNLGADITTLLRDIVGNPYQPVVLLPSPDRCKLCRGKGNVPAGAGAATMDRPARVPCERCHGRGWRTHPWLTPQVLSLAQAAYDERPGRECEDCRGRGGRWDAVVDQWYACRACDGDGRVEDGTLDPARLAILADALEEAGCIEQAILTHLRSPGPHVRGCWALDFVLGKE